MTEPTPTPPLMPSPSHSQPRIVAPTGSPTVAIPTFDDAYQTQRVLEASMISAEEKRWVNMDDVK